MGLIPRTGLPGPIWNDTAAAAAAAAASTFLVASNNLSDLTNVPVARSNLGLGSAALQPTTAFDASGAAATALAAAEAYARSLLAGAGPYQPLATNLTTLAALANPGVSGYVLSSTTGGVYSWVTNGTGTVTSVSVTTANGVSGAVATPTTTPAITLTLGAITPTSVNGNTITTGTGTLTLGSVVLNAGAGGTLGSNAFTSTAFVPQTTTVAGTALTGNITQDQLTGLSSTGLVKRTGSNTLAIAVAGTDYQAAGSYQPLATNLTTLAALANPGVSGYVLSSTTGGVYSWVANGSSSGFPITLGSTSIAAGSTTTSVNGLTIGAVTPAAGTFTTLIGQQTEGIQATNAAATVFYGQNTTGGTAAATKFGLANSSQQLVFYITDTAYAGAAIVTGGVARSATIFTDSPIPLILGTNGAANVSIASGGAVTLSSLAAASAGVVQSSTAGLLSALAYTGSTSTYLRADGTWGTPTGSGGVPPGGAKTNELRWLSSGTAQWARNGFVFPEDYGATGAGPSTDDSTYIMAAYAAVGPGQALFLSQTYGIGTGAALNFNTGKAIMSTGTAMFIPTTSSPATNGVHLSTAGNYEVFLPKIGSTSSDTYGAHGFSGYGVYIDGIGVTHVHAPTIANCGVAVQMNSTNGPCPDNWVEVNWVNTCTTALKVGCGNTTNLLQGNRFYFNYCGTVQYMFNFDGSGNGGEVCDSNELIIGATDFGHYGSGAIFYQNDQTVGTFSLSNWAFSVTMWNGNITDPTSSMLIAGPNTTTAGKFNACRFYLGNIGTLAAQTVSWINVNGVGNVYTSSWQPGGTVLGRYTWQSAASNVAAFCAGNVHFAGFQYNNTYWCGNLIPGNIAAGGTLTMYVYSPFAMPSSNETFFKVIPTEFNYVNPGLYLESIHPSPTGTAYEVKLIWRNATGAQITAGAGVGVDFMFVHGIP